MHAEVYGALDAGLLRCAAMAARALVDMVLTQAVGGDIGRFGKKLEKCVDNGDLSPSQKHTLEAAIEAGNAVAHRGFNLNQEQVGAVLQIVDSVLANMYVLGLRASALKGQIPPRT